MLASARRVRMSICLEPGVRGHIHVKDQVGTLLYEKSVASHEEAKAFVRQYGSFKQGCPFLEGLVMPLRTQTLNDCLEDLFLPTFIHFALKVENIALKIIASVFAIALDLLTLPIRFIALPLRVYYQSHAPEPKHPMIELIEGNVHSQKALQDQCVMLHYEVEEVRIHPENEEGRRFGADKIVRVGTVQIILQPTPRGENTSSELESLVRYSKQNGEWVAGWGSQCTGTPAYR